MHRCRWQRCGLHPIQADLQQGPSLHRCALVFGDLGQRCPGRGHRFGNPLRRGSRHGYRSEHLLNQGILAVCVRPFCSKQRRRAASSPPWTMHATRFADHGVREPLVAGALQTLGLARMSPRMWVRRSTPRRCRAGTRGGRRRKRGTGPRHFSRGLFRKRTLLVAALPQEF